MAILLGTVFENPYIPDSYKRIPSHPGDKGITRKQCLLLADNRSEVLYGGAGGGGKSVGILMAAAQYLACPNYAALILRRTHPQLAKPESILSLAKEWWLERDDVKYNETTHTFRFSSGARIEFGHVADENKKYNYQGAAYQYVGFDELTQFSETQYTYLFSRRRKKADSLIPLRFRAASNPGGEGHAWVYKRFIDPKEIRDGKKRGYIPAKLQDNPNLDRESYRESLAELDPITRAQIESGDWEAVEGGRFRKEWFRYYTWDQGFITTIDDERFRLQDVAVFATCDPCSTDKGDNFANSIWCVSPSAKLLWLACDRRKIETPEQLQGIKAWYRKWKPQFQGIEEVNTGHALAQLLRKSIDPFVNVRGLSPRGKDKLARAVGAINLASEGRLWLPQHPGADFPLTDIINELITFTGRDGGVDDCVDTLSYATECLVDIAPPGVVPSAVPPSRAPVLEPLKLPAPTSARRTLPKPVPKSGPRKLF
jgi:phage terminase large subunit-like protein